MNPAFDHLAVLTLLTRGINAGHWTLSDIDQPPPGWTYADTQAKRIRGFTSPPYVNLLRQSSAPAVQPIHPKDFPVAPAATDNTGQDHMDLLPRQWPSLPSERDGSDRQSHQDPGRHRTDHGDQAHLGTTWDDHPSLHGTPRPSPLQPGDYLEDPAEPDF